MLRQRAAVSVVAWLVIFLTLLLGVDWAITQEDSGESYRCEGLCRDGPGTPEEGTHVGIAGEGLTLRAQVPEHVSGTYVRDGLSLDFDTVMTDEAMSLTLRSGSGEVLLDFGVDRARRIRTAAYLGSRLRLAVDEAFVERLQAGDTSDAGGMVVDGDDSALDELERRPEYHLLAYLSQALGQQGITGNVYPATFSLHLLGMRVAGDLGVVADTPASEQGPQETASFQSASAYLESGQECRDDDPSCDDCREECKYDGWGQGGCRYVNYWGDECDPDYCDLPWCNQNPGPRVDCCYCNKPDLRSDPCGNSCLGMCGDDCSCWSFVCGDCAYHWGCDVHDRACLDCHQSWGFNVPQCLICWTPIAVWVAKFGC